MQYLYLMILLRATSLWEAGAWMIVPQPSAASAVAPLPTTTTRLFSSSNNGPVSRKSSLEEDIYEDDYDEVEALGGDTFFLEGDPENDEDEADQGFLWDGEIDENAHLEIDLD